MNLVVKDELRNIFLQLKTHIEVFLSGFKMSSHFIFLFVWLIGLF